MSSTEQNTIALQVANTKHPCTGFCIDYHRTISLTQMNVFEEFNIEHRQIKNITHAFTETF